VSWWGVVAPCTDSIPIPGLRPLQPSGWFQISVLDAIETVVSGMHEAHYKHDSLIPHQFSITNLILLIYGCICTGTLGHIPRHTG